jgi:hypothetical protein
MPVNHDIPQLEAHFVEEIDPRVNTLRDLARSLSSVLQELGEPV